MADPRELAGWILRNVTRRATFLPSDAERSGSNSLVPDVSGASDRPAWPSQAPRTSNRIEPKAVRLTSRQLASAERALEIVEDRNGVLLADRVGEGKTYIAIALIEAMLERGTGCVLVTGPAALRPQWVPLLKSAAVAHSVRLLRAERKAGPGRAITWLSHSMLSLRRWPDWLEHSDLVVVDEAHSMRNPNTQRYRSLAWLCRSARVILLTATPINNSLLDLYHQLRLFVGDGRLADLGVADLGAAMRDAALSRDRLRPPLQAALAELIVRQPQRTRARPARTPAASRDQHAELAAPPGRRRPRRVVPTVVRYDLDVAAPGMVDRVLNGIRQLELATFIRSDAGKGAAAAPELLRFGLVKRFESGPAALAASLRRLTDYLDHFADTAADGYYLPPRSRAGRGSATGDPAQLFLAPLALEPLGPERDAARLVPSARRDAERLRRVIPELDGLRRPDPKTAALIGLLREITSATGPGTRKAIVFTEFRDTATDLWYSIRGQFRTGLIHGGGAFVGTCACARLDVLDCFRAGRDRTARARNVDAVDVLVATDVLAEGFNLQDAGHAISFDLPWNPVRLLQRAGRIDRLGSPHEVVYCHSFVPTPSMDAFLRLVDRIVSRLGVIRDYMDDPHAVAPFRNPHGPLPVEGMARIVERMEKGDVDLFDDIETARFGFLETVQPKSRGAVPAGSDAGSQGDRAVPSPECPHFAGVRIDGLAQDIRIVVMTRGGRIRAFVVRGEGGPRSADDRALLLTLLEQAVRQNPPVEDEGSGRERTTDLRTDHREAAAAIHVALRRVDVRPIHASSPRARLINGLLEAIASEPGGPDPRVCSRADAVISQLRGGVSIGIENELGRLLRAVGRRATNGSRVLRAFETVLRRSADRSVRSRTDLMWRPAAVLELVPGRPGGE